MEFYKNTCLELRLSCQHLMKFCLKDLYILVSIFKRVISITYIDRIWPSKPTLLYRKGKTY